MIYWRQRRYKGEDGLESVRVCKEGPFFDLDKVVLNMTEPDLSVNIRLLQLKTPIMPASGAFGFEMEEVLDFRWYFRICNKTNYSASDLSS